MTRVSEGSAKVHLEVPCEPEYLALCRLVVSAMGKQAGLDPSEVADLKGLVTEAGACFVREAFGGETSLGARRGFKLNFDFEAGRRGWLVSTWADGENSQLVLSPRCRPGEEQGLGITVVRALADWVAVEDKPAGGSILKFEKRFCTKA